jgi:hypothetical protein
LKTDHDHLLSRYRAYREAGHRLHGRLRPYIPKKAVTKAARKLGLESGGTIVAANDLELAVLVDYVHFDHREVAMSGPSLNVWEKFARAEMPPEGSIERRYVEAALKARYGIVAIESVIPGVGLQVHDFMRDQRFMVVDVGLSQTGAPGMLQAARLMSPEPDLTFTTGVGIPLAGEDASDLMDSLEPLLRGRTRAQVEAMSAREWTRVAVTVIREAIGLGATERIRLE